LNNILLVSNRNAFVQETHSTLQTITQWKKEWSAKLIISHGSSNSLGVAIMMKNNLD